MTSWKVRRFGLRQARGENKLTISCPGAISYAVTLAQDQISLAQHYMLHFDFPLHLFQTVVSNFQKLEKQIKFGANLWDIHNL